MAKRRTRRNSFESAEALSETFHGRPPEEVTKVNEEVLIEENLANLGDLQEITIKTLSGSVVDVKLDNESFLAASPTAGQLYIVPQQKLNLKPFDIADQGKESVVLGWLIDVVYVTDKQHLGEEDKQRGPYKHRMGEDGGEPPLVTYDRRNEEFHIHGGTYQIKRDMGRYSAGIRN